MNETKNAVSDYKGISPQDISDIQDALSTAIYYHKTQDSDQERADIYRSILSDLQNRH